MPRRPFLTLLIAILFAAVAQAGVRMFSTPAPIDNRDAKVCSACGPIGDFCELK